MEIKQEIRSFFQQYVDYVNAKPFDDDADIFQQGVFVSSIVMIQIVAFVEKTFNIGVTEEDLEANSFYSINSIERYIKRKLAENLNYIY